MADEEVDVPALIAAFLADESTVELELPQSLTAEQRSQAKKVSQQHPELKCESYGFGEERRLHIFKKVSQDRVIVKNTFIDDWEGSESKEPAMFRSVPAGMPENLLERTLQRCLNGKLDLKQLATHAESVGSGSPRTPGLGAGGDVQFGNSPALPPMPDGFQVRNTFIHIESDHIDERAVRSMPHDMFRRCLAAEVACKADMNLKSAEEVEVARAPTPESEPECEPTVCPQAQYPQAYQPKPLIGAIVMVEGLQKCPAFNGLSAVVQGWDEAAGRYNISIVSGAGQQQAMVKEENLRLLCPSL